MGQPSAGIAVGLITVRLTVLPSQRSSVTGIMKKSISAEIDNLRSALLDGLGADAKKFVMQPFIIGINSSGGALAYSLNAQVLYLLVYADDYPQNGEPWNAFIARCAHLITLQLGTLVAPDQKSINGRTVWGSKAGRPVASFRFRLIDSPAHVARQNGE